MVGCGVNFVLGCGDDFVVVALQNSGRWEIGRFEQNAPLPILIASTNVQLDQMMRVSNEVQRKEACGGRVLFVLFERIRL